VDTADNPYESPRGLDSTSGLAADRVLTATFVIDEAWQGQASSHLTDWQQQMVNRIFAVMILANAISGPFLYAEAPVLFGYLVGLCTGGLVGAFAGLAAAFFTGFGMSAWNSRYQRVNYTRGVARVLIDATYVRLHWDDHGSNHGRLFPLQLVRHTSLSKALHFRVAHVSDRFHVPASADFGEDDFSSWRTAVMRRVKEG
jgi:hypothetical protein